MTTPITSPHNEGLKEVRRLQRRREREHSGRFVAEGEDLLAAADAAGWEPVRRFCAAGSGLIGEEVAPDALAAVSALGSGARALAVYERRWSPAAGPLCVYLHGVADPGNVGAILRSSLAFGASSLAVGAGCADPFGPRAVRASMGALFAVPVARAPDVSTLPGVKLALAARTGDRLREVVELLGAGAAVTILIGAEREGLPANVLEAADRVAHIPIASESLNAAMAATIALYELTKNRMAAT